MNVKIPKNLKKQIEVNVTKEELISFETEVKEKYEAGEILAPVHLAKDNEDELIEIFQYIHTSILDHIFLLQFLSIRFMAELKLPTVMRIRIAPLFLP